MGVGKTTVGRLLAARLERDFVDTDDEVERTAGRSIVECFQSGDEALFRDLEARAVRDAVAARPPRVVALGGGALLREDTRELLLADALLVFLHVPWAELLPYVPHMMETRPLLQGRSVEDIHALYCRRLDVYRQAHLTVTVSRTDPEAALATVLAALGL
jgi:shikimate kinase